MKDKELLKYVDVGINEISFMLIAMTWLLAGMILNSLYVLVIGLVFVFIYWTAWYKRIKLNRKYNL